MLACLITRKSGFTREKNVSRKLHRGHFTPINSPHILLGKLLPKKFGVDPTVHEGIIYAQHCQYTSWLRCGGSIDKESILI